MDSEGTEGGVVIRRGTATRLLARECNAKAEDIPTICQAWIEKVAKRGILAQYEPHYFVCSCRCSYQLGLPHDTRALGLRVSFVWEIDPRNAHQHIVAYLMAGQDLEDADDVVLSRTQYETAERLAADVVENVNATLGLPRVLRWTLYYLGGTFRNRQIIERGAHRVYESRRTREHQVITPVALACEGPIGAPRNEAGTTGPLVLSMAGKACVSAHACSIGVKQASGRVRKLDEKGFSKECGEPAGRGFWFLPTECT